MKNYWVKISCFLTGWNLSILQNCSEASRKQLKKYTSAIIILLIIWTLIGYLFADRYVQTPWWGSAIISVFFSIIIIQIERIVILGVGKNKFSTRFRIFLAVVMAVLGSTILDQMIFKDDIEKKMIEVVDRQVNEQLPRRIAMLEKQTKKIQVEIDSIEAKIAVLNNEIAIRPTLKTISTSTTYLKIKNDDGTYSTQPQRTISTLPVENPKIKEVEMNNNHLDFLRKQKFNYEEDKSKAENSLRNELKSKQGFLEELSAIIELLSESTPALIFYVLLFSFLLSLELLVVTNKLNDIKCDYDLIIEHQLEQKKKTLIVLSK